MQRWGARGAKGRQYATVLYSSQQRLNVYPVHTSRSAVRSKEGEESNTHHTHKGYSLDVSLVYTTQTQTTQQQGVKLSLSLSVRLGPLQAGAKTAAPPSWHSAPAAAKRRDESARRVWWRWFLYPDWTQKLWVVLVAFMFVTLVPGMKSSSYEYPAISRSSVQLAAPRSVIYLPSSGGGGVSHASPMRTPGVSTARAARRLVSGGARVITTRPFDETRGRSRTVSVCIVPAPAARLAGRRGVAQSFLGLYSTQCQSKTPRF